MKNRFALTAAIVGIIVVMSFFFQSATFSSRSGDDTPLYSVRRHDPYGTAALHDLLIARKIQVRTLERPNLEPSDHGVLIQVMSDEDFFFATYHLNSAALVDWISRGNTVVQLTRSSTDLQHFVKVSATTQPNVSQIKPLRDFEKNGGPPEDTPALVEQANLLQPNAAPLLLWAPMILSNQPGLAWKPLAQLPDKKHSVVAGQLTIGKGKLILVGAPTPALNCTIAQAGNLDFLLNLIGNQSVILDEWSHGIGRERTVISFLHDVGLLPMLLQVALVAGLYVWSTSGHGKPLQAAVGRQRSSVEQIETLGFLYSRSLSPAVTFERVNQEVQHRLATALRCKPGDLATRVATLQPQLKTKVEQLLAQLNTLHADQRVHCKKCGYDLAFNQSGACPECGTALTVAQKQKLADTQTNAKTPPRSAPLNRRPNRLNSVLANALSVSHQLTLEVTRDRRSAR